MQAGGDGTTGPGGHLNATGDIRNTNPMLSPLASNGGPTQTMSLLAGSPALDAGDDSVLDPPLSLTTDQRGTGFPRKVSTHVDIGAFEAALNVAPVNAVPGPQATNQNTPLVFSSGNGNLIRISDVDAGGSPVQVTLAATNGTITLSGITGLAFSSGNGTGNATMTFTGTIININAALNGLTFAPTANFNGPASLQIVTNDLGNTGAGGALTDTDNVAITVLPTLVSIDVTPINPSVAVGLTRQFTATGTFSDGSTQDLTATATWSSSDHAVATISNAVGSKGLATGISGGTTEIAAHSGAVNGATTLTVTAPPVDPCTTASLLDSFNRANGGLGSNWRGLTGTAFYRITSNRVDVQLGGPVYWNAASFGTNQAAFVTLSTVDTRSSSQGLLLKVQTGSVPQAGAIAVVYDALAHAVRVSSFRPPLLTWTRYASAAGTFVNGDKLGACVKSNGVVTIYKNNVVVATVTLNTATRRSSTPRAARSDCGHWLHPTPSSTTSGVAQHRNPSRELLLKKLIAI